MMLAAKPLVEAKDVAFFEEHGYYIAPKIIEDARLEELKKHMERIYREEYETGRPPMTACWKQGDDAGALRKTDNSHWADNVLRGLATDSQIGFIAAELVHAASIRLWHDQLLYKPGSKLKPDQEIANVGWHQDYSYWQCVDVPNLLTAWVAFDDVNLENGCMQVVDGSHRWGLLNREDYEGDFFEQDLQKQQARLKVPDQASFRPVPLVMKAGQVSFHHCLTLHGSGPNNSDRPRRSLAIHMMPGTTRYRAGTPSDHHLNIGILKPTDGDLLTGEMFPLLYQKEQ